MKIKLLIPIVTSLVFVGCASTIVPTQEVSIPELNTTTTSFLGDRLLMQAEGFYTDSITLGSASGSTSQINAGKYYKLQPNKDTYYSKDKNAIGLKNTFGSIVRYRNDLDYDKEKKSVCVEYFSCYDTSEISIKHKKDDFYVAENSFQQVIEYNGKSGNILNFTYREFSGGMARAPFTTNFTMDLSEGDVIGYKGAQIKIEKATNNKIAYIVIKNFSKY